jgi:hypothetical protein
MPAQIHLKKGQQMPGRIDRQRLACLPRGRPLTVAALIGGLLIAGCEGTSPGKNVANVGDASASASRKASAGHSTTSTSSTSDPGATSSGSAAPTPGGSGLAFANCMRANGVPNFPDPSPGAGVTFPVGAGTGIDTSAPAFLSAQAKCQKLLPDGGPGGAGPAFSEQSLVRVRKVAVCMRAHGIAQFPDPTTTRPIIPASTGPAVITDYDGVFLVFPDSLNTQSPAYTRAAAACGALAQQLGRGPHH